MWCNYAYTSVRVHRLVGLLWGLLSPPSVPGPGAMGTFSFPISSPSAPPIPGYLQLLNTGDGFLPVRSSQPWQQLPPPSPLPFLPRGLAWVPVRPMTEQQLVGGRENPGKPDSVQLAHSAQPLAGHDPPEWDPELGPGTLSPLRRAHLWGPAVGPGLGAVSLRLRHQQATPWPSVQRRGRGNGQSISGRAGARQQTSTGPWGLRRDQPLPTPLSSLCPPVPRFSLGVVTEG